VRSAILIGVIATAICGFATGTAHWQSNPGRISAIQETALHLDIKGALALGALEIVFVFLFVDLFDNVGTLVAVTQKAGLITARGQIPRLNRILFSEAAATIFGSLTGTSTVVSYI
jgi:AGZA family xanthine/uracil permease-like MFS transporter